MALFMTSNATNESSEPAPVAHGLSGLAAEGVLQRIGVRPAAVGCNALEGVPRGVKAALHLLQPAADDRIMHGFVLELPEAEVEERTRDLEMSRHVLDGELADRVPSDEGERLLHENSRIGERIGRFAVDDLLDADKKGQIVRLFDCSIAQMSSSSSRGSGRRCSPRGGSRAGRTRVGGLRFRRGGGRC